MFHILCSKYQSLVEGDSDDDGFREKLYSELRILIWLSVHYMMIQKTMKIQ